MQHVTAYLGKDICIDRTNLEEFDSFSLILMTENLSDPSKYLLLINWSLST